MRSVASSSLFVVSMLSVWPGAALAQSAVGAPTREEVQRAPLATAPPPGARITVEGEVERAPCPLADPAYKDITVTISGAQFTGLGGVPVDLVRPAYADLIGKTVTIASVCEIRDRAATILRRAGYLAAVQVPPQRIENGIVKFDVLMAKLVGFQVRGDAGKSEPVIRRYLTAIQDQPVFNILTAERYLLLARDLPGFDVRMTLRPAGTAPGEVIGEIQVVRTPIELDVNVQNLGSREVGRFGGIAQLRLNGLLGWGDRTTVGFFSTADFKEQQVAQVSEEIRVGREGLTLGADFNYAWTNPTIANFTLRSRTLAATLRARYPLIRRQTHNLFLSGGLDFVNQASRLVGTTGALPLSRDRLRVGFIRLDYQAIDPASVAGTTGYSISEPRWAIGGSVEARQGVNIFDASPDCRRNPVACTTGGATPPSRLIADPTAFVVRGSADVTFRPFPIISFSLQPRGQYSPHALLSYEQFSAGNYTIGRGFDPGTLLGDSGVGVRGEVTVGSMVPRSRNDLAIQGYGFIDAAWTWDRDPNSSVRYPEKLQSGGGGVRLAFGDRFQADAGVATPFRAAGLQTRRGDTRFLISLTAKLLPWGRN
ncbi:ShlB/FhaC/HecB family hemolysin secretion/activation protein [Sphingomonas sp.]|uniref:ShlB/FhaC/HecB family hemolysin secretion/activation protein n=1 Tax=Sphingomonas sp. TaxID=28214 RepID=UPI0025F07B09|nr:ShlB/FhaC/HecB family hemolysin secretion/activation protein [Sphingomonas sp.]